MTRFLSPLCLLLLLAQASCSSIEKVDYARPYPANALQTETLDIQAFRRDKTIQFTNTTARVLPPGTLWLNARFSRPFPGAAVGENIELPLESFRDEFGDPFRPGGFFASEAPDRLVLAQLEGPPTADRTTMLGLIVVQGLPEE